ncbi:MAG: aspartate kinase [Candidatus Eremiobacteraeota bacterium]|nr:aspartate kinase [Candidatus Eremiobacteraeota bacterium]MBC5827729.1 aspartate kinase [Candidatus Eremiobacteraeota bacterium]
MTQSRTGSGSVVVQKFGGSSLATAELRLLAAQRVRDVLAAGRRAIVVTSAIGRPPAPYATDTLLTLVAEPRSAANVDLLLSCGEVIGASVFAEVLSSVGVEALALTGAQAGIVTDAEHRDAKILRVEPHLPVALLARGITPVVAGFQGQTEDGRITTIGRGGSDLTAVALAAALEDGALEIFTDVDGIMTADPDRVPAARTIPLLDFDELTELTRHGAKVVYERAATFASSALDGLAITGLRSGVGSVVEAAAVRRARPVTAVTATGGFTFVHVAPDAMVSGAWQERIFATLADAGISLDCINVNTAGIFFALREAEAARGLELLRALAISPQTREDCAKVSIVGAGMRGMPGVMYRVVASLAAAGVPIVHSTDSHITISVLVPGPLATTAQRALHDRFGLADD